MKQRCAETVDIPAKTFGLMVQPFRCDVERSSPNLATRFGRCSGQPEVPHLCEMLVCEKYVGRLHVTVNQTFCVRCAQPLRRLNTNFQYLFFAEALLLLDQIIETSALHQFHHEIKLPV